MTLCPSRGPVLERPVLDRPVLERPVTEPHAHLRAHPLLRRALRFGRELAIVAVLFVLYRAVRLAVTGHDALADRHATWVHSLERTLRLPSEAGLQQVVAHAPVVLELANRYYVAVHFPLTIAFLVWGLVARPAAEYAWARNLLIVQTFLALAIHVAFPLAPPRMFPQWGFLDSGALWGPSPYHGASGAVANQFAAMPSLHIGWAVLIAVVVTRTGPRLLGLLACLHVVLTVFVVVVTANHYWIDGLVAVLLLLVALVLFPGPGRSRMPHPRAGWDARPRVPHPHDH